MRHNLAFILFSLFVLIHDPAGDRVASYDGMDQPTVSSLIAQTGFTFDFIDAPAYAAFISAHQPAPVTPAQILAAVHSQAVAKSISGIDDISTLERGFALVVLDELNILRQRDVDRTDDVAAATSLADLKTRWAARSVLPQRTAGQIQGAIQGKINAGTAD